MTRAPDNVRGISVCESRSKLKRKMESISAAYVEVGWSEPRQGKIH